MGLLGLYRPRIILFRLLNMDHKSTHMEEQEKAEIWKHLKRVAARRTVCRMCAGVMKWQQGQTVLLLTIKGLTGNTGVGGGGTGGVSSE